MGNGIAGLDGNDDIMVLHPSRSAVELMLRRLGYRVEVHKLTIQDPGGQPIGNPAIKGLTVNNPMGDYILGRRLIFIARSGFTTA